MGRHNLEATCNLELRVARQPGGTSTGTAMVSRGTRRRRLLGMLALADHCGQDATVTDPDDLRARAASIFRQLRSEAGGRRGSDPGVAAKDVSGETSPPGDPAGASPPGVAETDAGESPSEGASPTREPSVDEIQDIYLAPGSPSNAGTAELWLGLIPPTGSEARAPRSIVHRPPGGLAGTPLPRDDRLVSGEEPPLEAVPAPAAPSPATDTSLPNAGYNDPEPTKSPSASRLPNATSFPAPRPRPLATDDCADEVRPATSDPGPSARLMASADGPPLARRHSAQPPATSGEIPNADAEPVRGAAADQSEPKRDAADELTAPSDPRPPQTSPWSPPAEQRLSIPKADAHPNEGLASPAQTAEAPPSPPSWTAPSWTPASWTPSVPRDPYPELLSPPPEARSARPGTGEAEPLAARSPDPASTNLQDTLPGSADAASAGPLPARDDVANATPPEPTPPEPAAASSAIPATASAPAVSPEEATWAATRRKLSELSELLPVADLPDPLNAPTERPQHPGAHRPLPRILAIANQKGGVGKTTTAVNLGAGLAELGYRVLVVDLDPQGNASTGLGVNARNLDSSIYDVILHDVPMEDVIEPTTLRNLFVVPATIDLAGAEIELVPAFSRELRLRKAVQSVSDDYDFVVIDCPPSLGLLTVNGLAAASEVVVPIQCEYYALEGLGQLLRNVKLVQTNLNHLLEVSTIVLTMYDARTRLAEQVVNEVRQHFGDRVCRNVVPRTVRLSEAPSFGQPIIVFDPSSRGAIAYRELAKEVSGGAAQRVG